MGMMEMKFPYTPVGVNKWHRPIRVGGRVGMTLTAEYRRFVEKVASEIEYTMPFEGYVDIDIHLFMEGNKDTDGPIKAIIDAINKSGIISNDNKVRNIKVKRWWAPRDDQGFAFRIQDAERVNLGFSQSL